MSFFGDLFDFNGDGKITGLEWLCDFSAFFIVVFLIWQRYFRKTRYSVPEPVNTEPDDEQYFFCGGYEYVCDEEESIFYDAAELDREVYEEWQLARVGLNRNELVFMDVKDRDMILAMHGLDPKDYNF